MPKDLNDWTDKDVIKWAIKHYPDLLEELRKKGIEVPSGGTLAKLGKEDFKESYGKTIGAAFYNELKQQGTCTLRSVS